MLSFNIRLFLLSGMMVFYSIASNAGDFEHLYHKDIDTPYDYGLTDNLGNVYIISGKNLTKYNHNGEKIATYTNQYLGRIDHADVTDPFRLLLFYEEFNQVVFLDNFLAEIRSPINLDDLGYTYTSLVCSSGRGGLWLFDNRLKQLAYLNKNLQTDAESQNLNFLIRDKKPIEIAEKNQQLYLNVPDSGIFVFDQFASYIRTIPVKQAYNAEYGKNNIYYSDSKQLYIYNIMQMEKIIVKLPEEKNVIATKIAANKIYMFKKSGYDVYRSNGFRKSE